MQEHAIKESNGVSPCYNTGFETALNKKKISGKYDEKACSALIKKLLRKDTPCFYGNCSINGVYQPSIPKNEKFYAFSALGYMLSNYKMCGDKFSNPTDLNEISKIRDEVCHLSYEELKVCEFVHSFFSDYYIV